MPGFDRQVIRVAEGKVVTCFGLMTPWKSSDRFTIYAENDSTKILYDSAEGADGEINMSMLNLVNGTYIIDLDETTAAPGARVRIDFL